MGRQKCTDAEMSCTDCFRGTLQFFMYLINTVFFLAGVSVLGVAIWQLTLPGMSASVVGILLWVMLGTGILTMILALWGCGIASSQSRAGLCCYGFIMIVALVISVLYIIVGGVGAGMLTGATECGFNPESVNGTNCQSLEGVMNASAAAYMGVGGSCNATGLPVSMGGEGVICQSGDTFTQNIINSDCPAEPAHDDFNNCFALLEAQAPQGAAKADVDNGAFYFCLCPARFTNVYVDVINTAIIPGIVQSIVLFILTMSACCLMCMPKRREMVMQRYYMTQSPSQTPSQAPAQPGQQPSQPNSNSAQASYV